MFFAGGFPVAFVVSVAILDLPLLPVSSVVSGGVDVLLWLRKFRVFYIFPIDGPNLRRLADVVLSAARRK